MSRQESARAFRLDVATYFAAAGLPQARLRVDRRLLSEMFIEGVEYGDLFGFPDWTVQLRSHAVMDVSSALNEVRADSEAAGTKFHATVQRRRSTLFGTEDAIVSMSLAQFVGLLRDGLDSQLPPTPAE